MGGPNWTVYLGPKNQPYHNQPSEASLCSANRPGDGTAALFVATEIRGNIRRLGGWKALAIGDRVVHFNGSARSYSITHHNQPRLGSVGAELTRERRSGSVLWRAFFRNYGQQGGFKASLNCHRADKFDRCARSLASKT